MGSQTANVTDCQLSISKKGYFWRENGCKSCNFGQKSTKLSEKLKDHYKLKFTQKNNFFIIFFSFFWLLLVYPLASQKVWWIFTKIAWFTAIFSQKTPFFLLGSWQSWTWVVWIPIFKCLYFSEFSYFYNNSFSWEPEITCTLTMRRKKYFWTEAKLIFYGV